MQLNGIVYRKSLSYGCKYCPWTFSLPFIVPAMIGFINGEYQGLILKYASNEPNIHCVSKKCFHLH